MITRSGEHMCDAIADQDWSMVTYHVVNCYQPDPERPAAYADRGDVEG